jgi:uncharacterized SAM-binding protein YcdF (DUF218 family)
METLRVQSWEVLEGADCAVVLTGGRGRLRSGLQLLRRGEIRHLIISGVYSDTQLVDLINWQDELMNWGLPNLHLERQSRTTYGNAQHSWPLIDVLGCQSFYLITSQIHMPRAFKTFQGHNELGKLVIPRSVPAPFSEREQSAKIWESIKDVFYSYWAY